MANNEIGIICPLCKKPNSYIPRLGEENLFVKGVGVCKNSNCQFSFTRYEYINQERKNNIQFLPIDIVNQTKSHYHKNDFVSWLYKKFKPHQVKGAINQYNLGTTKSGETIFWVYNENFKVVEGINHKFCTTTGNPYSPTFSFLSERLIPNKELRPKGCFFGTHLINGCKKPIVVFDKPHKAVVASIVYPEFLSLSIYKDFTWSDRKNYPFVTDWFLQGSTIDEYFGLPKEMDGKSPYDLP